MVGLNERYSLQNRGFAINHQLFLKEDIYDEKLQENHYHRNRMHYGSGYGCLYRNPNNNSGLYGQTEQSDSSTFQDGTHRSGSRR
jgi:hypothetical protein